MYFFYDVLQLHQSLLEHTLLVKYQSWNSVWNDIVFLTADQLQNAAKTAFNEKIIDNFIIQKLQQNLVSIDMQILKSFFQKLMMWSQIKNLTVRDAMSAIWLMINLLNLWNSLVLILIRIKCSENAFFIINVIICNAAAILNSVIVA